MKKLLVLAASLVVTTLSSFAQGTVTFNNSAVTLVIDNSIGLGAEAGSRFLVALYYGVQGTVSDAGMVQIGGTTTFFAPGRFNGGTRTTPWTTASGASAVFQVRVWEAAFGSTWETAHANPLFHSPTSMHGRSQLFSSMTGGAGSPPSTPVALSLTFPGLVMGPLTPPVLPEPSTIALGVLGVGVLFLARRRKN